MTAPSWQGDHPRDRLVHHWACVRRPVVETVKRGRVTIVCMSCGADDDDSTDDTPAAA